MPDHARLIDITLPFSERLPVWPGDVAVQIARLTHVATVSELRMSSHVGTHLDAPAHFFPEGRTVDQLPLETLIGPVWVAEIRGVQLITAGLLDQAAIPADVERLLLKTDNSTRRAKGASETASPAIPAPFDEGFVALDRSAGEWLLRRHIRLAGIDGPSFDAYASADFAVHRLLLGWEMVLVEYVRLEGVDPGPYRLLCLPLHYAGGDGAPVRAVLETI
jgi:arylformamidase